MGRHGQKGHWDHVWRGPWVGLLVVEGSYVDETYLRLRKGKDYADLKP